MLIFFLFLVSASAVRKAADFVLVSSSSSSGFEPCKRVAPALVCALPFLICAKRRVIPVFTSPLKLKNPIAQEYQFLGEFSRFSIVCIAAGFGAPVTVHAHIWVWKASRPSKSAVNVPSKWSTV